MRALIQDLGLTVVLLKSGGSAKAKKLARDQIRRGEAQIVIGTQALIQQGLTPIERRIDTSDVWQEVHSRNPLPKCGSKAKLPGRNNCLLG